MLLVPNLDDGATHRPPLDRGRAIQFSREQEHAAQERSHRTRKGVRNLLSPDFSKRFLTPFLSSRFVAVTSPAQATLRALASFLSGTA
jgi:hypothetical protein